MVGETNLSLGNFREVFSGTVRTNWKRGVFFFLLFFFFLPELLTAAPLISQRFKAGALEAHECEF